MMKSVGLTLFGFTIVAIHAIATPANAAPISAVSYADSATISVDPRSLAPIAKIDARYQSYNIEMVSIIGGNWWAPYGLPPTNGIVSSTTDIDAHALSKHLPLDLANVRLRRLAAGLGPAYLRVSDKWANSIFFQEAGSVAGAPPSGFDSVLTAARWKSVIDFSQAAHARLVTSVAISPGTRGADGRWQPAEAAKMLRATRADGGHIAAAEFFNEPNLAVMEGAPKGYTAADYGRDFKIFSTYLRKTSSQTLIFGPGSVGELRGFDKLPGALKSQDMLAVSGGGLDGVSYHFYGAFSQRCTSMGATLQIQAAMALSPAWLTASLDDTAFYRALRDHFTPDRPLWLTETSQAACGGDRWAGDFRDTFRYLNQLGLLAGKGVSVSMHNTLIGSDYGLIDERTLQPRPDYWGALLWHKLMGTTVLGVGDIKVPNVYLYAFDLKGVRGGVAMLAINADPTHRVNLDLKGPFRGYTMSAASLDSGTVLLNGRPLIVDKRGRLPALRGTVAAGTAVLLPETISFFEIGVSVPSCRSC